MRKDKIYDTEYLQNYNYLIQDYRTVFDNMLDSDLVVPEKVVRLENKQLVRQFKKDVKTAKKRAKIKIIEETKIEKLEKKQKRKENLKTKLHIFFSKFNFKRKNKKAVEPESPSKTEM